MLKNNILYQKIKPYIEKIRSFFTDKTNENLFLLGIAIYAIKVVYKNSTLIEANSYQNLFIYGGIYLLMLPKVIFQKYNKKQLIASVAIAILAVVAYRFNPTRNMLVLPLVFIGIKGCDLKKVTRIIFFCTMSFVIVHTIGYFVVHFKNGGTLFNIPWFNRGPGRSTVLCKTYNNYGAITAMAIIQYLYLTNRDNERIKKFYVLSLLSIFFYAVGTSRTSLIISALAIAFLLLEKKEEFIKNAERLKIGSFFFLIIFSYSTFFMDTSSPIVSFLNILLSGRIVLAVQAKNVIGISLFPQMAKFLEHPMMLDNLVVCLVITYGLILTAIFALYVYYFAIKNKQNTFIDYFLFVTYIWALSERYPTFILTTLVPILVMYNFYENN